jgi:hypothetical protein
MWIEPIVRFAFQVVGGMCWIVAAVAAIAVWRVPQGDKSSQAWWMIGFLTLAGLVLIVVARRLKSWKDLPQILGSGESDKPKS